MTDHSDVHWNQEEIAEHLKSAMDTLTPDVLHKIDLTTPQDIYREPSKTFRLYRRMRTAALAAAACLCVAVLGGGVAKFQNSRVDSIVGIDVNPSIELSVNRNDKVLKADPLNDDAVQILDDMNLKGVDLDIAVNAVIGSMVRHGYFEELDNAILVTVANDDKVKAASLREDVVVDIEASLEEHKVSAIVYDQQASVTDDVKKLAEKYGISYGKAYFLQELVDENNLSEADMDVFAKMTMEEIAQEITERSYHVRTGKEDEVSDDSGSQTADAAKESPTAKAPETEVSSESSSEPSTEESTSSAESSTSQTSQSAQPTQPSQTQPAESESEPEEEDSGRVGKAVIDDWDYEDGYLNITFKEKVKWKNPTISVTGEDGSYSAKITDTSSESCQVAIEGLEGGKDYTYVLGGVAPKSGGPYSSVKGYFDTPDIADGAIDDDGDTDDEDETEAPEKPEETQPQESTASGEESAPVPETLPVMPTAKSSEEATLPPQTSPPEAGTGEGAA